MGVATGMPSFMSLVWLDLLKVGIKLRSVALAGDTLPLPMLGTWHYRFSARTGWHGVNILWPGEISGLTCNFCPSMPKQIHPCDALCMLLGHQLITSYCIPPRWPSGKASASRAKDPGFESRLRQDFFGVESCQWLKNWHSSGYPARRLAL